MRVMKLIQPELIIKEFELRSLENVMIMHLHVIEKTDV